MSSELIEQVKLQYKQSLADKAETLTRLWMSSENNPDDLLGFLHQLAGSAGMYGYDQITLTAADLRNKIKVTSSVGPYETQFQKLHQLLIDNAE